MLILKYLVCLPGIFTASVSGSDSQTKAVEQSTHVPPSDVILSFPRELKIKADSNTYAKQCVIYIDLGSSPKTAGSATAENVEKADPSSHGSGESSSTTYGAAKTAIDHLSDEKLDMLNNPDVLTELRHTLSGQDLCVSPPNPVKLSANVIKARLTKSEFKDQPTLHCTYKSDDKKPERTVRYVLPMRYVSDVLTPKRIDDSAAWISPVKGLKTAQAGVLDSRNPFQFTNEYSGKASEVKTDTKETSAAEKPDSKSAASRSEADRYFANVWCHAIQQKVDFVQQQISSALNSEKMDDFVKKLSSSKGSSAGQQSQDKTKGASEVVSGSTDRTSGSQDGGGSHEKTSSSTPEGLGVVIEYNHGAKFSKKDGQCSITMYTIDKENKEVLGRYHDLIHMNPQGLCFGGKTMDEVPFFEEPHKWSADLEMDPYSHNPNLKCYYQAKPADSRQLIAEYRLPFPYSPTQPLQQDPISYRDKAVKAAASQDGDKGSQESEETPPPEEKTHKSFWMGGTLGRMNAFVDRKVRFMLDRPKDAIEFIDKYDDASGGVDKTKIRGIGLMAAKYCSHLNYMKEAFLVASAGDFMGEFTKHMAMVREETYKKRKIDKPASSVKAVEEKKPSEVADTSDNPPEKKKKKPWFGGIF